ncbi:S49 family peptidase [Thioclava sp. A2]|uniref:S49 family peptidase n=1 Tax=Thioclava sp. FCG-A2 TaxID=3080562 RepID=UPI002954B45C|nr:S49 family peptidase [Thioclava sp. A2]MDV7272099.1 S49 family peptidase [Thioclava sp. A2]
MLHARIAARAFNTPLLVEPSKAMAFLSGLGPRILGRQVELLDGDLPNSSGAAALPARAGLLAGGLGDTYSQYGEAPYPVIDGIAVIEISGVLIHRGSWIGQSSGQTSYEGIAAQIKAAAHDPAIRGLALEIDSFGGEVAGVFDLADRIRATRSKKPVWAFVAEHAFSAGYALASQADRILLPRTGSVGSIGVLVMHTDLSGQLDQDGVGVTLIHSGRHKVDGNPYAPLPDAVRGDIQREIDALRLLFSETVTAGRGSRLSQEAALATEAATYRGVDAIAAGLADEVTDLAQGFARFRQTLTASGSLSPHPLRAPRASLPHPEQEACMATDTDPTETPDAPDAETDVPSPDAPEGPDIEIIEEEAPAPAPAASAAPTASARSPGTLAELSENLREAAAEIADIAAQAGRLGVPIDAAKALREGTAPEALRKLVLSRAAAAADARDIIAAPPSPVLPKSTESPIVAAAKRAASGAKI